jgi:hypothetical protein
MDLGWVSRHDAWASCPVDTYGLWGGLEVGVYTNNATEEGAGMFVQVVCGQEDEYTMISSDELDIYTAGCIVKRPLISETFSATFSALSSIPPIHGLTVIFRTYKTGSTSIASGRHRPITHF